MGVKLSLEKEEKPYQAIVGVLKVFILAFLMFVVGGVVSLFLAYLLKNGFNNTNLNFLEKLLKKMLDDPLYLFVSYAKWGAIFLGSLKNGQMTLALFLPIIAPLMAMFILVLAYVKSSYSFGLWYALNNHFAKLEDVKKMGILNGVMLVLGRFHEHLLGLCRPASVLCFGEAGCGKTTSVAIPSILRSDNMSIVAIDNSGALAQYTSGYRASLGNVFYFNWDLQDVPEKGSFYPRWNPLSDSSLPPRGEKRDEYLAFIAAYLAGYSESDNKENYWKWLSYTSIITALHFMVSKVRQAKANDYFLNQIVEKERLSKEDKDILMSYYVSMPEKYATGAIEKLKADKLTIDDYCPIGSWEGIAPAWQGKEICLAMFADWLLKNYLSNNSPNQGVDEGKVWLESLLLEAAFFNYNRHAISGIQQLSYLSRKQRQIVFPMILKPMFIFRNSCVRERTSGNDFNISQLRGMRNPRSKNWEPVTVYCIANTKSTKFISRLFVEMMINKGLSDYHFKGPFPLLMVVDDVGQMLKINSLSEAVARGPSHKMSSLLLCNSLHNVENVYSHELLEKIVCNTNYKIVMGDDNQKLSRQLSKLALFGTKSVQIPAVSSHAFLKVKRGLADASYYHRLAKGLVAKKGTSVATRGYQLLLAEGYYHLPVLAKNILFLKDDDFKDKAVLDVAYFIGDDILNKRVTQDVYVPELDEILYDTDLGIDDEVELDQFMDIIYDEAVSRVENFMDRKSVLVEDISNKWQKSKAKEELAESKMQEQDEDWWLEEEPFKDSKINTKSNPFMKKN